MKRVKCLLAVFLLVSAVFLVSGPVRDYVVGAMIASEERRLQREIDEMNNRNGEFIDWCEENLEDGRIPEPKEMPQGIR